MNQARPVRLFRHGDHQAMDIPREFELPGEQATIRKEGGRLVIEPKQENQRTLVEILATFEVLDEEFPKIEDLPADYVVV